MRLEFKVLLKNWKYNTLQSIGLIIHIKAALDAKGQQSRLESFFGKSVVTKRAENPVSEKKMKGGAGSKKAKVNASSAKK